MTDFNRVDFQCHAIFSLRRCVNEIEAIYDTALVSVKVERGSTFTYTRDLPYIVSILFMRVKFTCVRTEKLCDSGNPPLRLISTDAFLATHVNARKF